MPTTMIPLPQHIGTKVLFLEQTDSTNTRALELADSRTRSGLVIVAQEQTAGRGQYGRVWQSQKGKALLGSVLIYPPPQLFRPVILTAWAAVSVCACIYDLTRLQAKIKWPNDVLLSGKKVCGILIETGTNSSGSYAVVGIGLNVNQDHDFFAQAGLPQASSLFLQSHKQFEIHEVFETLIQHLNHEYDLLISGDSITLEACWKWYMGLLGKRVLIEKYHGENQEGRLKEMSFSALEFQHQGLSWTLSPEEIQHLSEIG